MGQSQSPVRPVDELKRLTLSGPYFRVELPDGSHLILYSDSSANSVTILPASVLQTQGAPLCSWSTSSSG